MQSPPTWDWAAGELAAAASASPTATPALLQAGGSSSWSGDGVSHEFSTGAAPATSAGLAVGVAPAHTAAGAGLAAAAAAAAAGANQGVTFAQLYQWLKASSWHGLRVLGHLAQNTPGTTQNSAVSPVLLTYTSPGLLACCRHNSRTSAGSMAQQGSMSKTLEGLQQLLQQPELDAVLGAAVRQQRLADVSFTLQELQATGLQAGGSSSTQLQYAATYGENVGRLAYQEALQSSGALQ